MRGSWDALRKSIKKEPVSIPCLKGEFDFSFSYHKNTILTDSRVKSVDVKVPIKPSIETPKKSLYTSPMSTRGKKFLKGIIDRFGHDNFDFLFFVYDDEKFDEEEFKGCKFIYEKRLKWDYVKTYVTPEYCQDYEYIFFWDDDHDSSGFSPSNFLSILRENGMEMAQPALSHNSHYSWDITLKDPSQEIGRFTNFVEIMCPVFHRDSWTKYWEMMEPKLNEWGWGYDFFAYSICDFERMGIIDCETIYHTEPVTSGQHSETGTGLLKLLNKYKVKTFTFYNFGAIEKNKNATMPTVKPHFLEELHFDVVDGCQLRCIGCPNSTIKPPISHISVEDFEKSLNNIDVQYIKLLRLFNFGEIFLHPNVKDILLQIPKQFWNVGEVEISSNGQVFKEDVLTEVFKTNIIDRFVISCDGDGTPEEYERLRPPAKWGKLMGCLKMVKTLKDKYSPKVELMTRTICEDMESRKKWNEILLPMGWTPEFREWNIFPDTIEKPWQRQPVVSDGICRFMGDNRAYIRADGTVVTCCVHPSVANLGNIKDQKYSSIANGFKRKEFINRQKNERNSVKLCNECEF